MSETGNVTVINTGNVANIRSYNVGDDWEIFTERLEQFLLANKVEEARKVSVLLTSINEDVYKILRNICHPERPSSKSFEELIALLAKQFQPKVSIYRKRIQFDLLRQKEESVNEWYVKVKKTAADCDFGNILEARVLDKFVVGMKPGPIIDRLCEEAATKTIREMLDIALTKEAALNETRGIEINRLQREGVRPKVQNINQFRGKAGGKVFKKTEEKVSDTVLCFYCGGKEHDFKKCKFKAYTCNKCKKKDILQKHVRFGLIKTIIQS